nr:MAG TPA: Putative Holin-like Toxin (Hol-Tox) [Caudoviricetes sp.]DAY51033.1 MAG TPA: Putative Holin-like Toxin (Hol-Tox) [Caudoviricetes sp.]
MYTHFLSLLFYFGFDIIQTREIKIYKAAYPLRRGYPSRCRKEGKPMTYTELFQFCTFVVALVGLCYTIFGKRK